MKLFVFPTLLVVLAIVSSGPVAGEDAVNKNVVIKKAERTVDIISQLVKVSNKITFENAGSDPVKFVLFALEKPSADHVSIVEAIDKAADEENQRLKIKATTISSAKDKHIWRIDLNAPIAAGKTKELVVDYVLTHHLNPFPSHIVQSEKQFVKYIGNALIFSPYIVSQQSSSIKLATSNIESYSKQVKPVSQSDNIITYGPFENKEPFSNLEIQAHYENNNPFLTVTRLERWIELSHWGNIAIEESVDVKHTGAILKGPFSRYEYQRDQSGVSSVRSFKTILPAAADDVYYRDEIGNVSTSNLRTLDDSVEVDIRPRFPLFGGWKTHYILGYNVPSYEYLFVSGNQYVLKLRLVDHIFDDMSIDEAVIRIVLPEGVRDITFKNAFPVKRLKDETHKTYLDTSGRTVIVISAENLNENHIQDFEITYKFEKVLLLQEPLLLVLAFYLLFLVVIIYVRLDFSLSTDEASETQLKIASFCDQVQEIHERRTAIYQQIDDALQHLKSSKDVSTFQNTCKKLNAELKSETQTINDILEKLKKATGAKEAAEKVAEIQKLDKAVKDQITLLSTQTEKLVNGNLSKPKFIESENTINKKRDELNAKIVNILPTL